MKHLLNRGIKALVYNEHRRFIQCSGDLQSEQDQYLMHLIKANADTAFGKRYRFDIMQRPQDFRSVVPVSDYDGFAKDIMRIQKGEQRVLTAETVRMMEPTSGSASATKYIPYTKGLKRDFMRGVHPWLYDLYTNYPKMLDGSSYWSISPVSDHPQTTEGGIPIGFDTDAGYFGRFESMLLQGIFPVGDNTRTIRNMEDFKYYTTLLLLNSRDLSLISVWSPSFLTLLLETATTYAERLSRDLRTGTISLPSGNKLAETFRSIAPLNEKTCQAVASGLKSDKPLLKSLWPKLQVVSCWTEAGARSEYSRLLPYCSEVAVQGKGLLATEGIVTFPLEGIGNVLAYRSHYFEFADPTSGNIFTASELKVGMVYSVIITTTGGFYRYCLGDLVQVEGTAYGLPLLRFLGKASNVSDLRGEKLHVTHVTEVLDRLPDVTGFRFLTPWETEDAAGYTLFICPSAELDFIELAAMVEEGLKENHHYRYARNLGQLAPLRIYWMASGEDTVYYSHRAKMQNARLGDIKPPVLDTFTGWHHRLKGRWATTEVR